MARRYPRPTKSWSSAPAAPRRKRSRGRAFSSEARIGSRQENASNKNLERLYCFGGMKVGPTVRTDLSLSLAVAVVSGGGAVVAGAAAVVPFLAGGDGGALFGCARCCIRLALSSVTMMSPCSTPALSSTDFSASDQVWPAALQAQEGLNSVRNLNAF